MIDSSPTLISVVIPTRDRPGALERCLDALDAQTVAAQLEVVVVDDGSTEGAVASVVGRHPRARSIRKGGAGPAAARNAGAREAHGSMLCFTDDDCVPGREWVERLVDVLRTDGGAVCGRTIPRGGVLANASELIAHAPAGPASGDTHDVTFAPSNNLACTKAVFDATPFDESYPGAAGEDREWCARLIASGHRLRYVPSALLEHHQSLTTRRFLAQQVRYGEGAFRYRRGGTVDRPLEPPSFYAALVRRAFGQGLTVGLLVCVAQGATAVGFIRGWASRRRRGASFVT